MHRKKLFLGDHIVLSVGVAIKRDNGVGFVMVEHIKHNRGVRCGELDRNVRIFIMEINIARIDHILANRVGRNDMDMTSALFLFFQIFHKICGKRMHLMRIGNQFMSALGERNGMIDALK